MRKTLEQLISVATDVQILVGATKFEITMRDDDSEVEIRVRNIKRLTDLASMLQRNESFIYTTDDYIVIRIYEQEPE